MGSFSFANKRRTAYEKQRYPYYENKEALLTAQTNLADSEKKLKEIEEQNQKAERNCSDLFTWASTYKGASFERRQAILKQFIKEVRVGRDYNIEIVLNVPLDEFEEFKRHAASAGRGKNQKNKLQNPMQNSRKKIKSQSMLRRFSVSWH